MSLSEVCEGAHVWPASALMTLGLLTMVIVWLCRMSTHNDHLSPDLLFISHPPSYFLFFLFITCLSLLPLFACPHTMIINLFPPLFVRLTFFFPLSTISPSLSLPSLHVDTQ